MSKERVNMIADLFEASMAATVSAAEGVADDRRMAQAEDGRSHPTWLLGHLTTVTGNAVIGVCLGQKPSVPAEYRGHFAPDFLGGEPIQSDATAYPSWDSILERYKGVAQEVVSSIRALDDDDLNGAPKGPVPEPLKARFEVLGASLVSMAMHNTYHTGQMNLLGALTVSAPVS